MAKPVEFDECNTTFVADGCGDLPAHVAEGCEEHPDASEIITCWELDDAELMEVLQTKRVWLFVKGTEQPPVIVTGMHPFEPPGETTEDGQPG